MNTNEDLLDADKPFRDVSPVSNQSSMAAYLRSGHGGPAFSVLAPESQDQILAHVLAMSSQEQTDYLARMKQMNGEELLASVRSPQASGTTQPEHYTVKKGESLTKIARSKGVRLSALIEANPAIQNPDLIFPGQIINVPAT